MKITDLFRGRKNAARDSAADPPVPAADGSNGRPRAPGEIVIDDRERASGLHEAVERHCGIRPRIERLDSGDILVAGRVLIERKTTRDLVVSITDGRLMRQAAELAAQPWQPVVIVEGEFTPEAMGAMKPAALRGAMASVMLDWRIPIFRARSLRETAVWISVLLDRAAGSEGRPDWRRVTPTGAPSGFDPRSARPVRRRSRPETAMIPLAVLGQIPGLGPERARALLARFGSPAGVARASEAELREVEGIGPRLALQIREALNGPE